MPGKGFSHPLRTLEELLRSQPDRPEFTSTLKPQQTGALCLPKVPSGGAVHLEVCVDAPHFPASRWGCRTTHSPGPEEDAFRLVSSQQGIHCDGV